MTQEQDSRRGGLRYPIEVVDRFTEPLQKFKREINEAKEAAKQFNRAGDAGVGKKIRKAGQEAAKGISVEDAARDRLSKRLRANAELREEESQAASQGLEITTRNLEALSDEERARRSLRRELQRERQEREKNALAQREGIETDRMRRDRLRGEERAARERRKQEAAARRDEAARLRDEQRRLRESVAEQGRLERFRQDLAREHERERRDQIASINAAGTAYRKQGELEAMVEQNRRRAAERAAAANQKARAEIVGATGENLRFNKSLRGTESVANRISFTFRRLFGIFAAFQLVREGGRLFVGLVRSGIAFNDTLETSRNGLAGIIAATAQVRDEQGRVVEGANAYRVAVGLARDQQEKLKNDALLTTATYEELLKAFQVAAGPGLSRGLNLDEVREFSVLISQAATAIDLPQNQLSEEIRALLTGNIRATTTRIAQVLNITNADVRRAYEAGELFEFLRGRLEGFALAAEDNANTLSGLFARLKGAFQLIGGEGAAGAFEEIRTTLKGVFDSLLNVERAADGAVKSVTPNPEIVAAFRAIFDGITAVVQRLRDAGRSVGIDRLQNAAEALGAVIEVVGIALVDVAAGLIRGFSTLRQILGPVFDAIAGIGRTIDSVFGAGATSGIVAGLTQALVVVIGLQVAFNGFAGVFRFVFGLYPRFLMFLGSSLLKMNNLVEATKIWVAESRAGQAVWSVIRSRAFLVTAVIAGIVAATKLFLENILDVKLEIGQLPAAFSAILESTFTSILGLGDLLLTTLKVRTQQAFSAIAAEVKIGLRELKALFDFELGASDDLSAFEKKLRAVEARQARNRVAQDNAALELEIVEAKKRQAQIDRDGVKRLADRLNKIRDEARLRAELADKIARQKDQEARRATTAQDPTGTAGPRPKEVSDEERLKLDIQRQQLGLRQAELRARQEIAAFDFLPRDQQQLEVARQGLLVLQEKLQKTKDLSAAETELFRMQNTGALAGQDGEAARTFAVEKLNLLKDEQLLKEEAISLEIERQKRLIEQQRLIAEGSFGEGLSQGAFQFAEQFSSSFQSGLNIARQALNSFANFVSQTIVDAFDPTKDTTIEERFGRFLQGIAQMILAELTKLAVARAILWGSTLGSADGGEVPATGRALGGPVPRRPSRRGRSHTRARGYVSGGRIGSSPRRPAGLSPKDTTPLWAQPGEWVIRLDSVRAYGADVMAAINEGLVNPADLRALAGVSGLRRRRRAGLGYVTGGEVGSQARATARAIAGTDAPSAQGGTTVQPVLVADNASVERLLAGGKSAFLGAIRDMAPDIEATLSRFRSRSQA